MPIRIFEHIKGSDLPEEWKEKLKADPAQTFTITIEPEDEYKDEEMPAEEMIGKELIDGVKESEGDIKGGRYTICNNQEETERFFNRIWNE